MPRRRAPISRQSQRRKTLQALRDDVRRIVLTRDGTCRGLGLVDGCTRTPTDVHELKRGAHRADCWLDPDRCIALCRPCHRWVTDNPEQAVELGLALFSWQPFPTTNNHERETQPHDP